MTPRKLDQTYHPDEARRWTETCDDLARELPSLALPTSYWGRLGARILSLVGLGAYAQARRVQRMHAAIEQELYAAFLADRGAAFVRAQPRSAVASLVDGLERTVTLQRPLLHVPGHQTDPDIAATILIAVLLRVSRNPVDVQDAASRLLELLAEDQAAESRPLHLVDPPPMAS